MARSIMDVIHENINPTSTSNALYETMLDWLAETQARHSAGPAEKLRIRVKRRTLEGVLARFLGVTASEVRHLLAEHFGVNAR